MNTTVTDPETGEDWTVTATGDLVRTSPGPQSLEQALAEGHARRTNPDTNA